MDKRKTNGGPRKGAGRKPKLEEIKVAEKFRLIQDDEVAIKKLADKVKEGDLKAIELWLAYVIGRPTQSINHDIQDNRIILKDID